MVNVRVNGQERTYDGDPSMPLLWFLRDELGLTGTKFGCGVALCGACTVHLNGEAIRACGITMSDVGGKSVVTIEGLDPKGEHPVQVAWRNISVPQCGYCQSRPDHAGSRVVGKNSGAHRQANRRRHVRQHLPLRLLSAHPHGRSRRLEGGLT